MIKVFKMSKRKVEILLKEYKSLKGALDFIESEKNYDYILYAMKRNSVIAIQGKQTQKTFFEKLFDKFHISVV
jgi:hypothetical protein